MASVHITEDIALTPKNWLSRAVVQRESYPTWLYSPTSHTCQKNNVTIFLVMVSGKISEELLQYFKLGGCS